MRHFTVISFLIFIGLQSFANVLNVPTTYTTIQAGLNAATVNDTILVQPGTYNENLIWPNTAGLKLLSAGDTTNTIVDGGSTGRCLLIAVSTTSNTIIKGFRFTNGVSTDWSGGTGAGIKIDNGASPTIDSCMVDNCSGNGNRCYGAGVSIDGGSSIITNSSILNNNAISSGGNYDYGGGMYITGSANVNIINSDISFNNIPTGTSRSYGGGIYTTGANLSLTDCSVNSNDIQGSSYCYGGGIYITSQSNLSVRGGEIDGNKLSNTSRTYGGGVYITGSSANFNQVKITNQDMTTTSFSKGNGLAAVSNSSLIMQNCLISDNMIAGTSSNYTGGGIASESSYLELNFCTVANNNKVGGGAMNGSGISFTGSTDTLRVTNSIIYNPNPSSEINFSGSLSEMNYSDVRGGQAGTGNINSLPSFVSLTDYHLQSTSPCLELANPASLVMIDIEGNVRPSVGSTVADMGCYEITTTSTGFDDNNLKDIVSIYPNPTTEYISIKGLNDIKELDKIEIISYTGKIVLSLSQFKENRIDVSNLKPGIYFLNFSTKQGINTIKLLKN